MVVRASGDVSAFVRVTSSPCIFNGKTGDLPYFGHRLSDSNCPRWLGNSGGPALVYKPDGVPLVVGVVSHTFMLDSEGQVDRKAAGTDDLGSYVPVTISTFATSAELHNSSD